MNSMKNITSAEQLVTNFDSFFETLCKEEFLVIELEVTASECKGDPRLVVGVNNQSIYSNTLSEGKHYIPIEVDMKEINTVDLRISMQGKQINDTLVKNGDIIKDKFIKINGLKINNYDIMSDPELFYKEFGYINDNSGVTESVKSGFWTNASLILRFNIPFVKWYQEHSTKNINLAEQMKYLENDELLAEQYTKLIENLKLLKK